MGALCVVAHDRVADKEIEIWLAMARLMCQIAKLDDVDAIDDPTASTFDRQRDF